MDINNSSSEKAEEALASSLKSIRSMNAKGIETDLQVANAIARNVLREETSDYGEFEHIYHLNDKERDTLLAHGRQDAANSMLVASSCYKRIAALQKSQRMTQFLLLIMIALLLYLAS